MFPLPNIILYFKFSWYNQEAKNNIEMVFSCVFFRIIERILFIIDDAHMATLLQPFRMLRYQKMS